MVCSSRPRRFRASLDRDNQKNFQQWYLDGNTGIAYSMQTPQEITRWQSLARN